MEKVEKSRQVNDNRLHAWEWKWDGRVQLDYTSACERASERAREHHQVICQPKTT